VAREKPSQTGLHAAQYSSSMGRPAEKMRATNLGWIRQAAEHRHLFRLEWMGERFFHLPADMLALQHIIWQVRPRLVIMTGIAAGGGPIFVASMLELAGDDGSVVAIDPALSPDVRKKLETHRMGKRIEMVEGNSVDAATFRRAAEHASSTEPVMVILDLIHTHEHVRRELALYGDLVSTGSYLVALDTIMEDLPADHFVGKPYGKGNNPGTAVRAFLAEDERFAIDHEIEDRVLMTLAPGGFLRRAR
jgi:cephalosporin hydroxylase